MARMGTVTNGGGNSMQDTRSATAVNQLVWCGGLAITGTILLLAFFLTPDPSGHGTHTQLGLPPCGFLTMTGYPCPGCGLTTSFAHLIRGEVGNAARANVFGVGLFAATVLMAAVSAWGLARRKPVWSTLESLHAEKIALALAIIGVVFWAARLMA